MKHNILIVDDDEVTLTSLSEFLRGEGFFVKTVTSGKKIKISLSEVENFAKISIADEGKAIAERSLKRLGQKGFSDGKALGTGLGVHYSMRAVKSWNGRIDFKSRLGIGTTVDVLLPVAATPTWFSDSIDLRDCTTIRRYMPNGFSVLMD